MERLDYIARQPGRFAVTGAPSGYDAYLAVEAVARAKGLVLFVAADDVHAQAVMEAARFFAPATTVLSFPAWDWAARGAGRHHDQCAAATCAAKGLGGEGEFLRARRA